MTTSAETSPATKFGKMGVDAILAKDEQRCVAARQRMQQAGYSVTEEHEMELIWVKEGGFEWIDNGFCQTYIDMPNGIRQRVLDYAPGQKIQPHFHDMYELFIVMGGAVTCTKWPDGLDKAGISAILRAGDALEVPAGVPHCLDADPTHGLQFHEEVGSYQKRGTTFVNQMKDGDNDGADIRSQLVETTDP